ncbi:dihydrodipicolinate synthase family protein [Undibacterium crateris]|uniref:dihydrodipicolinate synthase family protein n=1 Tax=Undibacterium crateris TaxID=2528175 RepID=UPI001389F90C|nr:dihydrodipicolinate synthase family protein [Undibacterium crateris]NDI86007.1 dihydrodipicolinate synthase family protein [Undibacterium crateris]
MWQGVIPAVTTKFTPEDTLDFKEMQRCFQYLMDAGCDGLIACGSLGEGPFLSHAERIDVLKLSKEVCGAKPALLTVAEASTKEACALAEKGARAGADGLMVVPSTIYHTNHQETIANLRAIAAAADLPVMIYSNRIAYRVDVTTDMLEELADDARFVAVKESSDDIRRSTEIINRLGDRYDLFTGVDNLAFEALTAGAKGWVAGLVVAFPHETVAIYKLIQAGRYAEALTIYRWFRPLLDLDVSSYLVQNIKLVEAMVIESNERVRLPRQPLQGEVRSRAEAVVRAALATRPVLPQLA